MKKIYYTWQDYDKDTRKLIAIYSGYKGIIKNIYPVDIESYVFATKLSYFLKIPLIFDKSKINKKTLIVAGIVDTGNTLEKVLKKKSYFTIISFWITPSKRNPIVTYERIRKSDEWIIFPWEIE